MAECAAKCTKFEECIGFHHMFSFCFLRARIPVSTGNRVSGLTWAVRRSALEPWFHLWSMLTLMRLRISIRDSACTPPGIRAARALASHRPITSIREHQHTRCHASSSTARSPVSSTPCIRHHRRRRRPRLRPRLQRSPRPGSSTSTCA